MAHQRDGPTRTVYIGNLPFDLTDTELADVFSSAGPVKDMRIMLDKETGRSKGFAFCEFYEPDAAEVAVARLSGTTLGGRVIRVDFADDAPQRGRGGGRDRDRDRDGRGGGYGGSKASANMASEAMARMMGRGNGSAGGGGAGVAVGARGAGGHAEEGLRGVLDGADPVALYQVTSQMAMLVRSDPAAARQALLSHPELTNAIFKAQVLLGMVKPPKPEHAEPAALAPAPAAAPLPGPAPALPGLSSAPAPQAASIQPPAGPSPQRPAPAAASISQASLSAANQQALIQRLLSMTPAQLDALPPMERAQARQVISVMQAQLGAQNPIPPR